MEKQLKCVLLLSLKEMALRKVAVLLWSDSNVLASISKFRFLFFGDKETIKAWRETVEDKIKIKMLELGLPESLMKQVIDIVRPISLEIRRWQEIHPAYLWNETSLLDSAKLCWTTAGAVDYRRTAEELVRCDKLNVECRYKMACHYCLEDYIPLLWDELPEEKKEFYYNGKSHFSYLKFYYNGKSYVSSLEFCWPHILKGELSKLDYLLKTEVITPSFNQWAFEHSAEDRTLTSFNQWAFEHSAEEGNKSAAEYFFQKLTHEEREASLMRAAFSVLAEPHLESNQSNTFSDLLCYLLALMTPEQQMEAIKTHPVSILFYFFDLPWQDLSLANAGLIWAFLPLSCYKDLLQKMRCRFEDVDPYFPKFLHEFFKQSPLSFKKYFLNQESESDLSLVRHVLSVFFKAEDSESVEVIFRNLDAADRARLVFHRQFHFLFYHFMMAGKWPMVELCLREATLSKEDRERLREAFMEECLMAGQIEWKNVRCFFEFLDETDASPDEQKKGQKCKLENCPPE